jgi:hypothetical protein
MRYWKLGWFLMLVLAVAVPAEANALSDVDGHWAERSIYHLEAMKILAGFEDGTFRPDETVTRNQFAKVLVAALGYSEEAGEAMRYPTVYRDVLAGHWASGFVQVASDLGFVKGYGDGTFQGDSPITRAEITAIMVRVLGLKSMAESLRTASLTFADAVEIPVWARGYVVVASSQGVITGYDDGTFRPSAPTSRAEASTIVSRFLEGRGLHYQHYGVLATVFEGRLLADTDTGRRSFILGWPASVFRNGQRVQPEDLSPFDELFMVGKPDALVFVEARYVDELGEARSINAQAGTFGLRVATGVTRTLRLEEGARVFRHGRVSTLGNLESGDRLYVVHSARTGLVRLVDAVSFDVSGIVTAVTADSLTLSLGNGDEKNLGWAPSAMVFLNGVAVIPEEVAIGDFLEAHLGEAGKIDYAEIVREVSP